MEMANPTHGLAKPHVKWGSEAASGRLRLTRRLCMLLTTDCVLHGCSVVFQWMKSGSNWRTMRHLTAANTSGRHAVNSKHSSKQQ
eukprot:scaffold219269_cov23-Tisochrysis_lutea.AAC.2